MKHILWNIIRSHNNKSRLLHFKYCLSSLFLTLSFFLQLHQLLLHREMSCREGKKDADGGAASLSWAFSTCQWSVDHRVSARSLRRWRTTSEPTAKPRHYVGRTSCVHSAATRRRVNATSSGTSCSLQAKDLSSPSGHVGCSRWRVMMCAGAPSSGVYVLKLLLHGGIC